MFARNGLSLPRRSPGPGVRPSAGDGAGQGAPPAGGIRVSRTTVPAFPPCYPPAPHRRDGRRPIPKKNMKLNYVWAGLAGLALLLTSCDAAERHASNVLQSEILGNENEADEEEADENEDERDEREDEGDENGRDADDAGGQADRTRTDRAADDGDGRNDAQPRTIEEAVNQRIDREKEKVRGHVDRVMQETHERVGQAIDDALGGGER